MTREGRAEVERFLHSCLSLSLLTGFILSDLSHLQKILPNSLSSQQKKPRSLLWDLAGASCSSLLSVSLTAGAEGSSICTRVPPAQRSCSIHPPAKQPCGKGHALLHPGTQPPPPHCSIGSSPGSPHRLTCPPLLKHVSALFSLPTSRALKAYAFIGKTGKCNKLFCFLSHSLSSQNGHPYAIARSEGALQAASTSCWWQIDICLSNL